MADDVTFDVADEPSVPLSVTDPSSESADFAIGDAIIDAVSPTVDVTAIAGGHRMTVHDINGEHQFDVMDGEDGATGPAGPGVPTGGTAGQALVKSSSTDYATEWHTPSAADLTGTLPVAHGGTGATTAAGALTALGAASAADVDHIGDLVTDSASVSLASATGDATAITSVTITAGTWVLTGFIRFAANATGQRLANISNTSGASSTAIMEQSGIQQDAVSSGGTYMNVARIITATSSTTMYLNVRQNSGSTLSTSGFLRAVRIK